MNRVTHLRASLQAFLQSLLFVPFVLAQFFAVGTMGHLGADGFEIVLCSGAGPVSVVIGPNGDPEPVDHSDQPICAWAVATQAALTANQQAPVALNIAWQHLALASASNQDLPAVILAIPPARGPPALV